MKALKVTGYGNAKENLVMQEVVNPTISNNEVLIKTHAASLNPIDLYLLSGNLHAVMPIQFPGSIGFDVAGTVVEKGSAVKNLEVGDEVYSRLRQAGAIAEYVTADSAVVAKKPEKITFEEAAGLPLVGLTVTQALQDVGGIKPGHKVFIQGGSGGIGTFAVQYAKSKGAYVATTTSTKNVALVKELGADLVIDYTKEDYTQFIDGYDIVLITLGDQFTLEVIDAVENIGKLISLNGAFDEQSLNYFEGEVKAYMTEAGKAVNNAAKAKGVDYRFVSMQPNGEQLGIIAGLVDNQVIKPIIDKTFNFDDSIEAYEYLATGRAKGKVIIKLPV